MDIGKEYYIGDLVWVKGYEGPEKVKVVGKMRERNYFTYELRNEKLHMWSGPDFIFNSKEEVK